MLVSQVLAGMAASPKDAARPPQSGPRIERQDTTLPSRLLSFGPVEDTRGDMDRVVGKIATGHFVLGWEDPSADKGKNLRAKQVTLVSPVTRGKPFLLSMTLERPAKTKDEEPTNPLLSEGQKVILNILNGAEGRTPWGETKVLKPIADANKAQTNPYEGLDTDTDIGTGLPHLSEEVSCGYLGLEVVERRTVATGDGKTLNDIYLLRAVSASELSKELEGPSGPDMRVKRMGSGW